MKVKTFIRVADVARQLVNGTREFDPSVHSFSSSKASATILLERLRHGRARQSHETDLAPNTIFDVNCYFTFEAHPVACEIIELWWAGHGLGGTSGVDMAYDGNEDNLRECELAGVFICTSQLFQSLSVGVFQPKTERGSLIVRNLSGQNLGDICLVEFVPHD